MNYISKFLGEKGYEFEFYDVTNRNLDMDFFTLYKKGIGLVKTAISTSDIGSITQESKVVPSKSEYRVPLYDLDYT